MAPIESTFGDLFVILFIGLAGAALFAARSLVLDIVLFSGLAISSVLSLLVARRNSSVSKSLTSGWVTLVIAMVVSTIGGVLLESYIAELASFAQLMAVVTLVSSNAGAVYASRMSTALHMDENADSEGLDRKEAIVTSVALLFVSTMSIGGYTLVSWLVHVTSVDGIMAFAIVCAGIGNSVFAVALAHLLTKAFWRRGIDPDYHCLPLLTAVSDVTGAVLVLAAFKVSAAISGRSYALGA